MEQEITQIETFLQRYNTAKDRQTVSDFFADASQLNTSVYNMYIASMQTYQGKIEKPMQLQALQAELGRNKLSKVDTTSLTTKCKSMLERLKLGDAYATSNWHLWFNDKFMIEYFNSDIYPVLAEAERNRFLQWITNYAKALKQELFSQDLYFYEKVIPTVKKQILRFKTEMYPVERLIAKLEGLFLEPKRTQQDQYRVIRDANMALFNLYLSNFSNITPSRINEKKLYEMTSELTKVIFNEEKKIANLEGSLSDYKRKRQDILDFPISITYNNAVQAFLEVQYKILEKDVRLPRPSEYNPEIYMNLEIPEFYIEGDDTNVSFLSWRMRLIAKLEATCLQENTAVIVKNPSNRNEEQMQRKFENLLAQKNQRNLEKKKKQFADDTEYFSFYNKVWSQYDSYPEIQRFFRENNLDLDFVTTPKAIFNDSNLKAQTDVLLQELGLNKRSKTGELDSDDSVAFSSDDEADNEQEEFKDFSNLEKKRYIVKILKQFIDTPELGFSVLEYVEQAPKISMYVMKNKLKDHDVIMIFEEIIKNQAYDFTSNADFILRVFRDLFLAREKVLEMNITNANPFFRNGTFSSLYEYVARVFNNTNPSGIPPNTDLVFGHFRGYIRSYLSFHSIVIAYEVHGNVHSYNFREVESESEYLQDKDVATQTFRLIELYQFFINKSKRPFF